MPFFRVILAVLVAAAALVFAAKARELGKTRGLSDSIRTLADPNALRAGVMVHPTVYYIDPNGEAAGLEYDLISAFAQTQQRSLTLKTYATPDAARLALMRGEIDGDDGVSADGTRATEVATKARYQESGWVLLNSPQKFTPKSFAELLPRSASWSAHAYFRGHRWSKFDVATRASRSSKTSATTTSR